VILTFRPSILQDVNGNLPSESWGMQDLFDERKRSPDRIEQAPDFMLMLGAAANASTSPVLWR
jgi:hypothetical protein